MDEDIKCDICENKNINPINIDGKKASFVLCHTCFYDIIKEVQK